MKKVFRILLVSLVVLSSAPAFAGEEEAVIADALIMRPVGLFSIVVGASIFVVALPFAAITGTADKAAKVLVVNPVDYTFKRPIGDFDYKPGGHKNQSSSSGQ